MTIYRDIDPDTVIRARKGEDGWGESEVIHVQCIYLSDLSINSLATIMVVVCEVFVGRQSCKRVPRGTHKTRTGQLINYYLGNVRTRVQNYLGLKRMECWYNTSCMCYNWPAAAAEETYK